MGDAAHVVERADRGKAEPPIEVLRRQLRRKRHLARAGMGRGSEEKAHYQATSALPPGFGNGGNPRHERLATLDERECQAARRDGHALAVACRGWREGGQRDQAARVVRIGNAEIGNPLFLGEDPAPDLECGESFVRTDRGDDLDPGGKMVARPLWLADAGVRRMGTQPAPWIEVIIACRSASRSVRRARA